MKNELVELVELIIGTNQNYHEKYGRDLLHEFGCDSDVMSDIVLKCISPLSKLELEQLIIPVYGKECIGQGIKGCGISIVHIFILYGKKVHIGITDIVNIIKSFKMISEDELYSLFASYINYGKFNLMAILFSLIVYDAMKECEALDYKIYETLALYDARKYILELKTNAEFTDIYGYLKDKCGNEYIENFIKFVYGNHGVITEE